MKRIILYVVISIFTLTYIQAQQTKVKGNYFTYDIDETITAISLTTDTADYSRGKHEGAVHIWRSS